MVGEGITRDLVRKVDQALFGNTTTNGPSGLESLAPVDEVQTVTINGGPSGGTFTLTFNGQTTGNLNHNAAAATVQTALQGLSTIGSGNTAVSGSAGGPYTITFGGTLAGTPVSELTAAHALTGGTTPSVTVATTDEGVYGYASVDNGGAYADIDPFSDAIYEAANHNATVSAFVTHPATAKSLATLKESTGSNKPLLGADPTAAGKATDPWRAATGQPVRVHHQQPDLGSLESVLLLGDSRRHRGGSGPLRVLHVGPRRGARHRAFGIRLRAPGKPCQDQHSLNG